MNRQRINYLEQVVNFWRFTNTQNFKSNDIAIYFYLLEVNNSCGWKESFFHNNKKVQASVQVSFKTMKLSLRKLREAGLIEYFTQNGSPNIKYKIKTLSKFPKVLEEVSAEVRDKVKDEINKTKDKQNNNNNKAEIKSDINIVFKNILEELQSKNEKSWVDVIYKKFDFKQGCLSALINEFKLSVLAYGDKEYEDNLTLFKRHFTNWLNKIENNGKLNGYKKQKHKDWI
ncbi:hypothetical protein KFZ70_00635 [Tamlana fucoidanivorans]|uniref:DUF7833 domain-containing protein n=1 Tax=Allotamlana fucoidanivorans TaxID=2583814 RepID=A0A5C4SLZ4_9FLAO|nr:hypothetical protein [Tamlana fucoidanivorans]TNJ44521.1 hypothetical protein FGF67_07700 [Tamlana fucoidanivorans]